MSRKPRYSPTPEEAQRIAAVTVNMAGKPGLTEEITRELHEQFRHAHAFEQTELLHGWQTFALANVLNISAFEAKGVLQMGRALRLKTNPKWEKVVTDATKQFNYYIKRTGINNADKERVPETKTKRKR